MKPKDKRLECVGGVGVSQRLNYSLDYPAESDISPRYYPGAARQIGGKAVGKAFFNTKAGLELWDLAHNKLLRRWPGLTKVDTVDVSPRLTVMAVHRGKIIEFWKFDSRWLG